MLKMKKKLTTFTALLMLLVLCAAGLPSQKALAAADAGAVSGGTDNTLERPVITKLRNTNIGVKVARKIYLCGRNACRIRALTQLHRVICVDSEEKRDLFYIKNRSLKAFECVNSFL